MLYLPGCSVIATNLSLLLNNLLNIYNALRQNLLEDGRVLELLLDLVDQTLRKLLLLALLNLGLIADPGVKDGLDLVGELDALLELKGHGLEFSRFLGDGKEVLGNVNNTSQLGDRVNPLLDSLCMVRPSTIQDVLNLLGLSSRPLGVRWPTVLPHRPEDREKAEGDDSLIVDDVELVGDSRHGDTRGGGEDSSLGGEGAAWEGVENGVGLALGVDGDVWGGALIADQGWADGSWEGSGRAEAGSSSDQSLA